MKKLFRKINNSRNYFFLGLLILAVAVIMLPQTANAAETVTGTIANTGINIVKAAIASPILIALGTLSLLVIGIFGALDMMVISFLVNIVQYNNFINEPSITAAWVIVRDLCNMFFILILLVIAFATILRLPNYEWKKLLPKLLIMAVLINFSRTICGLIIDFSQVIMMTFTNAFGTGGSFVDMTQMAKYFTGVTLSGFTTADWSVINVVIGLLIGIMFLIISGIVLVVAMSVFLMRIVMLWIYIVLSPLAFLAAAFPAGQKYATQWWSGFVQYIINGPVLAFFIWMALITSQQKVDFFTKGDAATALAKQCFGSSQIMCMGTFMPFILSIGMLIGGLMITQQIGGIGSSIAGKGLDWAKAPGRLTGKLASWGGKKLGGFVEQKLEEHGLPFLTRGYWQGFGARGERLRDQAKTRAMGKGEQLAEERWKPKFWKKRAGAMDVAETRRREVIVKIIGDINKSLGSTANPRQEMQHQAKLAYEAEGIEGKQRREAVIEMATSKGNLDDVYESLIPHFRNQIEEGKIKESDFADRFGMSSKEAETYSTNKVRRFMAGYLEIKPEWVDAVEMPERIADMEDGDEKEKEKEAWRKKSRADVKILLEQSSPEEQNKLRTMAAASEVAKEAGHWEQFNTVKDPESGKYAMMPELDRQEEALGEMKKQSVSKNLTSTATHPMRVTVFNEKTGEWIRSGRYDDQEGPEKDFWKNAFGGQHVRDIHRAQTRMAPQMVGQYFDSKTGDLIKTEAEAIKNGFKDVDDLKGSMGKMRGSNKIIFDALYRLMFYGSGASPKPVYGDEGWTPVDPSIRQSGKRNKK